MAPFRILYAGDLGYGQTCLERKQAIENLGFQIVPFDVRPLTMEAQRLTRSAAARFHWGPLIHRLNEAILALARSCSIDGVWIDKGLWIRPQTLAELRRLSTMKLAVHYTPDSQFHSQRSQLFYDCLPQYDLCVTTKPFELEHYCRSGARRTLLVLQGFGGLFDPGLSRAPGAARYRADAIFVGHRQPHYVQCLGELAGSGVELAIHGPKWPGYGRRHRWARQAVKSGGIWGRDYAMALASARIGVGLLGKHIPETTTTRSFEIPASGALLLAERTEDHLALFEEDVEAVFWTSREELCDKAHDLLSDETARARIARAGWRRCHDSGYDTQTQMRRIMAELDLRAERPG